MLVMSYNYVQAHDAEKTNFVSGITVLKQKVWLLVNNVLGQGSSEDFQRQQDMIRNYKELLSYMKSTSCTISISQPDMESKITSLTNLTPIEYNKQALQYSSFASQVYEELQRCEKE